jgi:hypothetical protein
MVLQPIPEFENSLSLQFIIQEEKERYLKLPTTTTTTTTIATQPHTFFQNTSSTSHCLKIVVHDHSKQQGAFYYICVFLFCCFFEVNKVRSATPPTTFKIVNNGVNSAVVAPTTEFSTPNSKSLQPNSGCILRCERGSRSSSSSSSSASSSLSSSSSSAAAAAAASSSSSSSSSVCRFHGIINNSTSLLHTQILGRAFLVPKACYTTPLERHPRSSIDRIHLVLLP